MTELLINLELKPGKSYQQQIREKLVELISKGQFGGRPLPSSRRMAKLLGVSRNTVVLVYESLVDEGYLLAKERSGFFVNPEVQEASLPKVVQNPTDNKDNAPKWSARIQHQPSAYSRLNKDKAWLSYPYPFIYGQIEAKEFPIYQWRECLRIAQSRNSLHEWVEDYIDDDDPELVAQIRQQILSKRGIVAEEGEVLVTMGTQNSLFMLASLLAGPQVKVGMEDPGYADLRNIFKYQQAQLKPLDLDDQGLVLGEQLRDCDYVCVTPSHQYPTTVTMPLERRQRLLAQAERDDFLVVEDDYESEVNFIEAPLPALKSLDSSGRVIYVGSLSKSLSPGLRLGYIVADRRLIDELRALRRLNYRHPPANNQRTLALFIAQGYYDSHVRRMRRLYEQKWWQVKQGLDRYLSHCQLHSTPGSFCFWLGLPDGLSSEYLVAEAAKLGILVESGDSLFFNGMPEQHYIRIGFSAIESDKIEAGLSKLGELISQLTGLPRPAKAKSVA